MKTSENRFLRFAVYNLFWPLSLNLLHFFWHKCHKHERSQRRVKLCFYRCMFYTQKCLTASNIKIGV